MAKKIYPGNYVNRLSAWQGQPVVAWPTRQFFHVTGYALITTNATSWDIRIPSPDMRADDKPRADITSLVLPVGACPYFVGFRIPDMRKERSTGTAFTGLVGTSGERLKVADAVANDNNITTAIVATNSADAAFSGTTITPRQVRRSIVTAPILAGAETLRVWSVQSDGTTLSTNGVSSTVPGGTPIIVEVAYFIDDDVAELEDVRLPYRVEN
ncbi:MAG: hypothetical protein VKI63_06085 [Cyanobium sp.]|nr:hypothetical protein [Cyanobium sp.]